MSKNYKGGYKLISLDKIDMLEIEVGVVIAGIHKAIESSYGKPLLLTGIVIDGVEKNDVYVGEYKVVDGSFVIKAYGYEITISADDEVEAVEIHVPVVKSVTSSAETKEIDIKDGDEFILSSTRENGTNFILPNDVNGLIISGVDGDYTSFLDGFSSIHGECNIMLLKGVECYVTRIGGIVMVALDGNEM